MLQAMLPMSLGLLVVLGAVAYLIATFMGTEIGSMPKFTVLKIAVTGVLALAIWSRFG